LSWLQAVNDRFSSIGIMAQHGAGLRPIGLQKGLAQRRRHHALLGLWHMRHNTSQERL
jgi:hypothetical protein